MGCCVATSNVVPPSQPHGRANSTAFLGSSSSAHPHDRRRQRRMRFAVDQTRKGFRIRLRPSAGGKRNSLDSLQTAAFQDYNSGTRLSIPSVPVEAFEEPVGASSLMYMAECTDLNRLYHNYVNSSCGFKTAQSDSEEEEAGDVTNAENVWGVGCESVADSTSDDSANHQAFSQLPPVWGPRTVSTARSPKQSSVVSLEKSPKTGVKVVTKTKSKLGNVDYAAEDEVATFGGFAVGERVLVASRLSTVKSNFYTGQSAPFFRENHEGSSEVAPRNVNEVHVVGDPLHPKFLCHVASVLDVGSYTNSGTFVPNSVALGDTQNLLSTSVQLDTTQKQDDDANSWSVADWQREQYAEFCLNVAANAGPASSLGGTQSLATSKETGDDAASFAALLIHVPKTNTSVADRTAGASWLTTALLLGSGEENGNGSKIWRRVVDSMVGRPSHPACSPLELCSSVDCAASQSTASSASHRHVHRFVSCAAFGGIHHLPPLVVSVLTVLAKFTEGEDRDSSQDGKFENATFADAVNEELFAKHPELFPSNCHVSLSDFAPDAPLTVTLCRLSELVSDAILAADESYYYGAFPSRCSPLLVLSDVVARSLILLGQLTEIGYPCVSISDATSSLQYNWTSKSFTPHRSNSIAAVTPIALELLEPAIVAEPATPGREHELPKSIFVGSGEVDDGDQSAHAASGFLSTNRESHNNSSSHLRKNGSESTQAPLDGELGTSRHQQSPLALVGLHPHPLPQAATSPNPLAVSPTNKLASGSNHCPAACLPGTSRQHSLLGAAAAVSFSPSAESLLVTKEPQERAARISISSDSFAASPIIPHVVSAAEAPEELSSTKGTHPQCFRSGLASTPGYHAGHIVGIRDQVGTYGVYELVAERMQSAASILCRRKRRRARRRERAAIAAANRAKPLLAASPSLAPPRLFGANRNVARPSPLDGSATTTTVDLGKFSTIPHPPHIPVTNVKTVPIPVMNVTQKASAGGGTTLIPVSGSAPVNPFSAQAASAHTKRIQTFKWSVVESSASSSEGDDVVDIDEKNKRRWPANESELKSISSGEWDELAVGEDGVVQKIFESGNEPPSPSAECETQKIYGGASLWSVHPQPTLELRPHLPQAVGFSRTNVAERGRPLPDGAGSMQRPNETTVPRFGFMDAFTDNDISDVEDASNARSILFGDSQLSSLKGVSAQVRARRTAISKRELRDGKEPLTPIKILRRNRREFCHSQQHSVFVPKSSASIFWWLEAKNCRSSNNSASGKLASRKSHTAPSIKRKGSSGSKTSRSPGNNLTRDWERCFLHYSSVDTGDRICGCLVADEFMSQSNESASSSFFVPCPPDAAVVTTPLATSRTANQSQPNTPAPSTGGRRSSTDIIFRGVRQSGARSWSLNEPQKKSLFANNAARSGSSSAVGGASLEKAIFKQCLSKVILRKKTPVAVVQLDDGSVLEGVRLNQVFKLVHAVKSVGSDSPNTKESAASASPLPPIMHIHHVRANMLLQRERLIHALTFLDEVVSHISNRKGFSKPVEPPSSGQGTLIAQPLAVRGSDGDIPSDSSSNLKGHATGANLRPPIMFRSPIRIVDMAQHMWENSSFVAGDRAIITTDVGSFTGTIAFTCPREVKRHSIPSFVRTAAHILSKDSTVVLLMHSIGSISHRSPSSSSSSAMRHHQEPEPHEPAEDYSSPLMPHPLESNVNTSVSAPRPRLATVPPNFDSPSQTTAFEMFVKAEEERIFDWNNCDFDCAVTEEELLTDGVTQKMLDALLLVLGQPDSALLGPLQSQQRFDEHHPNVRFGEADEENAFIIPLERNFMQTAGITGTLGGDAGRSGSSQTRGALNDTRSSHLVPLFSPGDVCEASVFASASVESHATNPALRPVTEEVWSLRGLLIPLIVSSEASPSPPRTKVCIDSSTLRNTTTASFFTCIMNCPLLSSPSSDELLLSNDNNVWPSSPLGPAQSAPLAPPADSVQGIMIAFTQRLQVLVRTYQRLYPVVVSIPRCLWPSLHGLIVDYATNASIAPDADASLPETPFAGGKFALPTVLRFQEEVGVQPAPGAASATTANEGSANYLNGGGGGSGHTLRANSVSGSGSLRKSSDVSTGVTTQLVSIPTSHAFARRIPRVGALRVAAEQSVIGRPLNVNIVGDIISVPLLKINSELAVRSFRVLLMKMLRRIVHALLPPEERRYNVHTLIGDFFCGVPHSEIALMDDD